jgi:outer membrane putative beta-barrel porin/alpha-amylase
VNTSCPIKLLLAGIIASTSALSSGLSYSAHPLVTEDTGTQGRGKFQLELQFERARDHEVDTTELSSNFATVLSYGFHPAADVIVTLPYERASTTVDGDTSKVRGRGDAAVDIKWRFYEHDNVSLAFKSGVALPTGDETRGLGTGKSNVSALLIASFSLEPIELHVSGGYIGNRNVADEKKHIRQISVGGWYAAGDLKFAADVGTYTTVDRTLNRSTSFGILGLIYSPTETLDLDVGVKWGLTDPEVDRALLAGVTLRF